MTAQESRLPTAPVPGWTKGRGILQGLAGFLDWTLTLALAAAVPLAVLGALSVKQDDAPWSRWALLWAVIGAFAGATLGAIGWAAWVGSRRNGILFGVIAGTLMGLLAAPCLFGAAYEPLSRGVAGVTENIPRAMLDGLIDWFSTGLPAATFFALGTASVIALAARITDRSKPRG